MDKAETGRRGEAAAAKAYEKRGCTLLCHGYRGRFGEIDLILKDAEGALIFCEVKTRGRRRVAAPAEAVDRAKRQRIVKTAQEYLQHTDQSEKPIRFDVAEVTPLDSGGWMVHIIKGAFICEG